MIIEKRLFPNFFATNFFGLYECYVQALTLKLTIDRKPRFNLNIKKCFTRNVVGSEISSLHVICLAKAVETIIG